MSYNPVSTYRIQFHKDFTFGHLEKVVPYLIDLGISTLYVSPILKSVPGSMHGYDGVDPLQVNPEIGTIEQLRAISKRLKEHGIGWVQDIVPNHMAFHSDNLWLMDVLEKGPLSDYHTFFDLSYTGDMYEGPVMVPFLGSALADVIDKGELKLSCKNKKFSFEYFGSYWPVCLQAYPAILNVIKAKMPDNVKQYLTALSRHLKIKDKDEYNAASRQLGLLFNKLSRTKGFNAYFNQCAHWASRDKQLLKKLADQQHYRLCSWQDTDTTINYRRFFTVNGLICLNIQRPEVFSKYHQLINTLVKECVFQGLRLDHIDGLYNPTQYLQQLRELVGGDTYIIAEKILESGEQMPANWPIQGNTGYDFLAMANNLLTSRKGEATLADFYSKITGENKPVAEQISDKKRHILSTHMVGEWGNLTRLFISLSLAGSTEYKFEDIKQAIGEFLIACPVYRFYGNQMPLDEPEAAEVKKIFNEISGANPQLKQAIELLENALLHQPETSGILTTNALKFYQRCMQFTGPLMAKGVEDTLMYTRNHAIVHNEVGDSPGAAGWSIDEFHAQMLQRQQLWPLSLNGTATHDTKRGEDVRARLQVLPDIAGEWMAAVTQWQKLNESQKQNGQPDVNDEYFIYQTLMGTYPMPGTQDADYESRLTQYLEKTLREGKQNSNWAQPNEAYESATKAFALQLLNKKHPFWQSFLAIQEKVARFGVVNSLCQLVLKFTCPGVPDTYQGCEHWDLSMVDPDNRRPVSYDLRGELLSGLPGTRSVKTVHQLWKNFLNGQVKIFITSVLSSERKANPTLFLDGEYLPLKVEGAYKNHVMAYARKYSSAWCIVVLPLGMAALTDKLKVDLNGLDWKDTRIALPAQAPKNLVNLLSNTQLKVDNTLLVSGLFTAIPIAIIKN